MPDTTTWGALGVALYAAGLSTYNVVVRRRERKQELVRDVLVTGGVRGDVIPPVLTITAANRAVRAVEIARVGVVVERGLHVFHPPTPNLPAHLDDGQSVTVELQPDWLDLVRGSTQKEIVRIMARDSMGHVYYSDWTPDSDQADGG